MASWICEEDRSIVVGVVWCGVVWCGVVCRVPLNPSIFSKQKHRQRPQYAALAPLLWSDGVKCVQQEGVQPLRCDPGWVV